MIHEALQPEVFTVVLAIALFLLLIYRSVFSAG